MRIFAGFLWRGASNYSGVIDNVDFYGFQTLVFGMLGNEANILIQYYLVACRLSTDLKTHDLEWLFYVKF